jgi:uncharacterized membrane protein YagU involved in acid resistance
MKSRDNFAITLVKGAVAGAVATLVLDRITTFMYERESPDARKTEDRARGGITTYETAAERIAALWGTNLDAEQRKRLGLIIHWALGIAAGVAYATYGRKRPSLRRGAGSAFGTAFWAAVDEGLVSMLGLTPPPKAFPVETHVRGLAGHLAFGIVTDRTLRLLDAVT